MGNEQRSERWNLSVSNGADWYYEAWWWVGIIVDITITFIVVMRIMMFLNIVEQRGFLSISVWMYFVPNLGISCATPFAWKKHSSCFCSSDLWKASPHGWSKVERVRRLALKLFGYMAIWLYDYDSKPAWVSFNILQLNQIQPMKNQWPDHTHIFYPLVI